jgi:hypothetical protein
LRTCRTNAAVGTLIADAAARKSARCLSRSTDCQALRRLRPCARRAAMPLRPPLVAMRARKPCRRLSTSLLG